MDKIRYLILRYIPVALLGTLYLILYLNGIYMGARSIRILLLLFFTALSLGCKDQILRILGFNYLFVFLLIMIYMGYIDSFKWASAVIGFVIFMYYVIIIRIHVTLEQKKKKSKKNKNEEEFEL